jgi:hypothetical protein
MSKAWSYPNVAKMNRRQESTTSANVGVYEKPFGGMITRTPNPQMPGNANSIETPQGEFFDAEEYLRRVGLR